MRLIDADDENVLREQPTVHPNHIADVSKKVEQAAEIAQNTSSSCAHENDVRRP